MLSSNEQTSFEAIIPRPILTFLLTVVLIRGAAVVYCGISVADAEAKELTRGNQSGRPFMDGISLMIINHFMVVILCSVEHLDSMSAGQLDNF